MQKSKKLARNLPECRMSFVSFFLEKIREIGWCRCLFSLPIRHQPFENMVLPPRLERRAGIRNPLFYPVKLREHEYFHGAGRIESLWYQILFENQAGCRRISSLPRTVGGVVCSKENEEVMIDLKLPVFSGSFCHVGMRGTFLHRIVPGQRGIRPSNVSVPSGWR